jgi:hypothetical protein
MGNAGGVLCATTGGAATATVATIGVTALLDNEGLLVPALLLALTVKV